jgi:hypothetical protein
VSDTRDIPDREVMIEPVTAGGGAHDVSGADAPAHVADSHDAAAHVPDSHDVAALHASGHDVAGVHDAHDDQPLGAIDWATWRATLLGVAVGAMICVLLYLAIR